MAATGRDAAAPDRAAVDGGCTQEVSQAARQSANCMQHSPTIDLLLTLVMCMLVVRGRRSPGSKRHERKQRQRKERRWNAQQRTLDEEAGGEGRNFKPRFAIEEDDDVGVMPSYPPSPSRGSSADRMLVLQWPESLCAATRHGCLASAPIHPYFTVHGLWPIARHMVSCRSDFDPLHLASIERELDTKWPSFFKRSNRSFWQHEYEKHGSCLYATIDEYFEATLALQRNHTQALLATLNPGLQALPLQAFSNAVQDSLGVQPMLMCQRNHLLRRTPLDRSSPQSGYDTDEEDSDDEARAPVRGTEQLLVEIGLCFSRDGALKDCPEKGRIRRCRRNQLVLLPAVGTFTEAEPVAASAPHAPVAVALAAEQPSPPPTVHAVVP